MRWPVFQRLQRRRALSCPPRPRRYRRGSARRPPGNRRPRGVAIARAGRHFLPVFRQRIPAASVEAERAGHSATPRPGSRPSSSRAAPMSTAAIPTLTPSSRYSDRARPQQARSDVGQDASSWGTQAAIFAPIWQLAVHNGVGPRVGHSGIGLIPGFPFTAPYEDISDKGSMTSHWCRIAKLSNN